MVINLNTLPKSWPEITYGDWCAIQEKGVNEIEYFTGMGKEQLQQNTNIAEALALIFDFLHVEPPTDICPLPSFDFLDTTLHQKFTLESTIREHKENMLPAYGQVIEVYQPTKGGFNGHQILWVIHRAKFYLEAYKANEEFLSERLEEIPLSPEEIAAGVKEMNSNPFYSRMSLLNGLSGGDINKHSQCLELTMAEVNAWLLFNNMTNAKNYRIYQQQKAKTK